MAFSKSYKLTSVAFPTKVYASSNEWISDHPQQTAYLTSNDTQTTSGKLLSESVTLSADGQSVVLNKVWIDQAAHEAYKLQYGAAISSFKAQFNYTEL